SRRRAGAGDVTAGRSGAPRGVPGKRTLTEQLRRPPRVAARSAAAPPPSAAPAAPVAPAVPPSAILQSPDARVNGRTVAAIAHELKQDLLNLAEQVNRFLASIQLERRDLQREHDRNTVMGVNPADYDEDNPEDPHIFDGVFPLWHKLLGEIVAHV